MNAKGIAEKQPWSQDVPRTGAALGLRLQSRWLPRSSGGIPFQCPHTPRRVVRQQERERLVARKTQPRRRLWLWNAVGTGRK